MLVRTNLKVRIKKEDIIEHLMLNRENHIDQYEKAREGYLKKVMDKIAKFQEMVIDGQIPDNGFRIGLNAPELKSKEYDKAIAMFEMSVDATIELSTNDFDMIVNDNWDWIVSTKLLNSTYINY